MADVKGISISEAEQANSSSVWALNNSGGRGRQMGKINITITEGNGRSSAIAIPVTKIPLDLTTKATKSALLMSPDFRRLVAAQIVKLISEENAMRLLDNDDAREEMRRLMSLDSHATLDEIQANAPAEVKNLMASESGNIGGFALNIAHTEDGEEDAILAQLRNNVESLSREELSYIVNNSKFPKVKGYAAERIVGS
jgi:hypothetical protein